MFDELFDYMYFVVTGKTKNRQYNEYRMTIENVAYFMKSVEKSYTLFGGIDDEKSALSKEDFALSYNVPRHRLLLLLVLLCVYVGQNDEEESMTEYTKALIDERTRLFKTYGFPADSDYCVCLDWCSDDIPENVTLIDLPDTGSATADKNDAQSSHTKLVRGILNEADAIWVLCSDNGMFDPDLANAIYDVMSNSKKNKVCIYNCKNGKPDDSGPINEFLGKMPFLIGERCYVVNALAGEYKYIQNGVNVMMTINAFLFFQAMRRRLPTETQVMEMLADDYYKEAYCTFITSKDNIGRPIVSKDSSVKYTLDTFFENLLAITSKI